MASPPSRRSVPAIPAGCARRPRKPFRPAPTQSASLWSLPPPAVAPLHRIQKGQPRRAAGKKPSASTIPPHRALNLKTRAACAEIARAFPSPLSEAPEKRSLRLRPKRVRPERYKPWWASSGKSHLYSVALGNSVAPVPSPSPPTPEENVRMNGAMAIATFSDSWPPAARTSLHSGRRSE